jgi:hypothetical protein
MSNVHDMSSKYLHIRNYLLATIAIVAPVDLVYGQSVPENPVVFVGQTFSAGQTFSGTPRFSGGQTASDGYTSETPGSMIRQTNGSGSSTAGVSQTLSVPEITATVPRQIELQATAAAVYDSNVPRSNALHPLFARAKKADFYFPLGVFLNVVVPTGRNVFSLSGSVTYNLYAHDTYLDSEDIDLTGRYRRDFQPCVVDSTGVYRRGRTDFSNTDILIFDKNIQSTSTAAGTLSCGLSAGLRPYASVSYSVARNSQFLRRINDHDTVVYGAGITLTSAPIGTIGIIGSISRNEYGSRPASGVFGAHAVHVRSIGGSFQRNSARILQASLQLNYTVVEKTSSSPGFHGLSGMASVQFVPGGRLVFNGLVSRSVQTSLGYNADYIIETDCSLIVSAAISPRLRTSLTFDRQHQRYIGAVATPDHLLKSDTHQEFGGSASYVLSPRVSLLFSTIYHDRSANDPIFNYSGMRISAGASVRI